MMRSLRIYNFSKYHRAMLTIIDIVVLDIPGAYLSLNQNLYPFHHFYSHSASCNHKSDVPFCQLETLFCFVFVELWTAESKQDLFIFYYLFVTVIVVIIIIIFTVGQLK